MSGVVFSKPAIVVADATGSARVTGLGQGAREAASTRPSTTIDNSRALASAQRLGTAPFGLDEPRESYGLSQPAIVATDATCRVQVTGLGREAREPAHTLGRYFDLTRAATTRALWTGKAPYGLNAKHIEADVPRRQGMPPGLRRPS